ncbi:hypothetical protein [Bradyrhizobium sp. CCBAU 53380]|uniref:hypothetical protein n=1 Tax=Bradyrhizobium sp. CCBAU 53380 TaxID=1325117 RepID=UPI0023039ACF|nr:hypothetical protein [Bradyrhizobium sp. CCBAU 53380]
MSALEPAVFLAERVADRAVELINTPLVFCSPRRAFLPSPASPAFFNVTKVATIPIRILQGRVLSGGGGFRAEIWMEAAIL